MRVSIWDRIVELLRKHKIRKGWVRAMISLACVVIFVTTNILIMPAVTLSAECGVEEHTHTDACYETHSELTCSKEEHTHSDACYDEEGNLICGKEEHTHSDSCYTTETVLVCGKAEHTHSDACFAHTEETKTTAEETGTETETPAETEQPVPEEK